MGDEERERGEGLNRKAPSENFAHPCSPVNVLDDEHVSDARRAVVVEHVHVRVQNGRADYFVVLAEHCKGAKKRRQGGGNE